METNERRHSRALVALIGAVGAAIALAACGSSSPPPGTTADPASTVPAQASVYLDATLKPEGALAHDARADGEALTGNGEPLTAAVEELGGAAGLPAIHYSSEVKPWVGPHAGVFLTSLSALEGLEGTLGDTLSEGLSVQALIGGVTKGLLARKGVDGALVLDASDLPKARSFVAKLASRAKAHSESFDGVSYDLDEAGGAIGVVGKFAVIGTEAGIKSVIETHAGGDALAGAATYTELVGKTSASSSLLDLYVDAEAVASAASSAHGSKGATNSGAAGSSGARAGASSSAGSRAASSSSTGAGAGLLDLLPGEPHAALLTLVPESRRLTLNARLLASSSESATQGSTEAAEGAKLVGELPASSWLAIGAGGVGKGLRSYVSALGTVAELAGKSLLANFGGAAIETLAKHFGANASGLEAAFSGKANAGAIFAGGRGLLELEAGLVFEMRSPADAQVALGKLAAVLRSAGGTVSTASLSGAESSESAKIAGLPLVLDLGTSGTRVALGLGPGSVEAALSPSQGKLAGSPLYGEASKSLAGSKPSILLDFPTLLSFLEGLGLTESKSLSSVVPYLRSLGALTGGFGNPEGDVEQLKLVLPLAG